MADKNSHSKRPDYAKYMNITAKMRAAGDKSAPRAVDLKKEATMSKTAGLGAGAAMGSNVSQVPSFWYSPELTMESWLLPKSRQEILKWCRLFFNLEPYIQSIITMHAYYPLSKFELTTEDDSITAFYEEQIFNAKFDLLEFLLQLSLSYWKFGEAIVFGNMVTRKNERTGQDEHVWDSMVLLEPELVEIRQGIFDNEPSYELIPTDELRGAVKRMKAGELESDIAPVIVKAIEEGRNIPLDPKFVSTVQNITDPSATRGTPSIQCCFKALIYQDYIRLAQMAIATRYHFPVELWTLGDVANDVWPSEEELGAFRDMVNQSIQNPPATLVYPPIVRYEALSVMGKLLPVGDDYDYIHDQILTGLGVNKTLIKGEGPSFSNVRTMALEKLIMVYQTIRNRIENWILNDFFRPLAEANNFYKEEDGVRVPILPSIHWHKDLDASFKDSIRDSYVRLHTDGYLSTKTLFSLFPDLDYDTERKHLEEERGTIFDKGNRLPKDFMSVEEEEALKEPVVEDFEESPVVPEKPDAPQSPQKPSMPKMPDIPEKQVDREDV